MVSSLLPALALLSALHSVPTAAAAAAAAAEDSGLSWTIYHSWNPNQDFVRRGSLEWGPTKINGNGNGDEATSDNSNGNGNGKEFRIINDGDSANLKGTDIREMLEYGWYHVKIQSQTDENRFVFQTVPACNLRRANFKDQFEITLPRSTSGDQQDPLTSFAYTPLVSPLAPADCADYNDDDNDEEASTTKSFSSRVSVQLDTPAMILKTILSQPKPPPGIAFVKQPQQQGQSRGGGTAGNGDNYEDPDAPPTPPGIMGFFSKYWYIILPVMILQVLQAPEDPPPGQQQQQGQQQQGQQQQGGTIAPQASGSAPKARRGKTSRN